MGMVSDRIKGKIAQVGEPLAFTKLAGGAGTFSVQAICQIASSGSLGSYLDDVEMMGVVHPGVMLTLSGDSGVIIDDAFTRDGRSYTVLKTFAHRIGSEVVSITAVAS